MSPLVYLTQFGFCFCFCCCFTCKLFWTCYSAYLYYTFIEVHCEYPFIVCSIMVWFGCWVLVLNSSMKGTYTHAQMQKLKIKREGVLVIYCVINFYQWWFQSPMWTCCYNGQKKKIYCTAIIKRPKQNELIHFFVCSVVIWTMVNKNRWMEQFAGTKISCAISFPLTNHTDNNTQSNGCLYCSFIYEIFRPSQTLSHRWCTQTAATWAACTSILIRFFIIHQMDTFGSIELTRMAMILMWQRLFLLNANISVKWTNRLPFSLSIVQRNGIFSANNEIRDAHNRIWRSGVCDVHIKSGALKSL